MFGISIYVRYTFSSDFDGRGFSLQPPKAVKNCTRSERGMENFIPFLQPNTNPSQNQINSIRLQIIKKSVAFQIVGRREYLLLVNFSVLSDNANVD